MDLEQECPLLVAERYYPEDAAREDIVFLFNCCTIKSKKTFAAMRMHKSSDCDLFYIKHAPSDKMMFGIIASKRIGNAVMRNYVKRRIRHAFRQSVIDLNLNVATIFLFICKKSMITCKFEDLYNTLRSTLLIHSRSNHMGAMEE